MWLSLDYKTWLVIFWYYQLQQTYSEFIERWWCMPHSQETKFHKLLTSASKNASYQCFPLFSTCYHRGTSYAWRGWYFPHDHYNDVIMGTIASQTTSLTIVYSIVYSDADQRKHQSCASLAFVRGINRGPVNSPHKWPVMRIMFPFVDVIMIYDPSFLFYSFHDGLPEKSLNRLP